MSHDIAAGSSGRAVITGMGAVTPIGKSLPEMWDNLLKGKSGIGLISQFDTGMIPWKVGAEVPEWIPEEQVGRKLARETDRFIQYAMVAAAEALKDSGLDLDSEDRERFGVVFGNSIGGIPNITRQQEKITAERRVRVSPHFITSIIPNMASGHLSVIHGLYGPNITLTTACSSGADSLGTAMMMIRTGRADVMLAGGTESLYCSLVIGGLGAARALSNNNDPATACRPFDLRRDGMVMGEGSGVVVVERLDHALRRGAVIYGEVLGYWNCSDGYHVTAPSVRGQVYCMSQALRDAGIGADSVDYINAHGTSTPLGDKTETESVKEVFGNRAYSIPVSSTKAVTGHMLGAAGAVEAIICLKAMENGIIPPTLTLEEKDPECDLDYVPGQARHGKIKVALSNSFGFGGQNATLVLSRLSG